MLLSIEVLLWFITMVVSLIKNNDTLFFSSTAVAFVVCIITSLAMIS
jgi:hypothetical protein